ncbi:unnamed protein product [Amaranthus hypochondriacus]
MSFRSKRTFADVQQSVEQSSTLEYNIDKTHSPKLAKASVKVSNRWGPFSPSTLRPTNAPQFKISSSKEILHDTTRPMIVKPRLSSMLQSSTIVAKSPQRGLQDQCIGPKPPRKAPQEFVHTSQVPQTTPILPLFHSPPSVIEVEHSPPLESVPTSTVSVHSPPNNNDGNRSSFEGEDLDQEKASKGENVGKSKASKPRHQILIKDWPDNVPFDEMKNVATIDINGTQGIAYGTIQPHVVWNETNIRYVVNFNSSNQPIGKGGDVLTSFLGDIATRDAFCPIELKNWHKLRNTSKVDILDIVRKHFVIPEGKVFDSVIMKRIGNAWRKHRHILKETHFNEKLSKEENYAKYPSGVKKLSWEALVDYWFSPDFKKYSNIGKQAREALGHVHRSGPTSFANQRVHLEKEKGTFSELEFYERVYSKKDGSFKGGTLSQKFMDKAKTKVIETLACSSKSQVDIENSVFDELMYGGKSPKRPLNHGFGVKKSDIYGVQSSVGHGRRDHVNISATKIANLEAKLKSVSEENETLSSKVDETNQNLKMIASNMTEILRAIRDGKASCAMLDDAEAALNMFNNQNIDVEDEPVDERLIDI